MNQMGGAGRVRVLLVSLALLVSGCGSAALVTSPTPTPAPFVTPSTSSSPVATSTPADPSALRSDLEQLDTFVRSTHASPFTIHSEAEWVAKLADVSAKLAEAANGDEQLVLLASVVALLDTHSSLSRDDFHFYPVYVYHFVEGWYVIAASDRGLVGSKLVSIGGHPVDEVEQRLRGLVPFDNEDGFLLNGQPLFSIVEYLHGAGIIADPQSPEYVFQLADGSLRTPDLPILDAQTWGDILGVIGTLVGGAPEAVRRHLELNWSRLEADGVLLLTVNDYGDEADIINVMQDAFDSGDAQRLVLDIRYVPGGSGDFQLLGAIKANPQVNKPGVLTVLIGRENFSVATKIVREFDVNTAALLVGEPTPARADNFRCDCTDIALPAFGATVTVPTQWDNVGDDRPEIAPDVEMRLSAEDFFAGGDPVLDAALSGIPTP